MKSMKMVPIALVAAVAAFIYSSVQVFAEDITSYRNDAEKIVREATRILNDSTTQKTQQKISASTFENAAGIAVFPGRIEKEYFPGGYYARGVVLVRQENDKWSPPLFVSLSHRGPGDQIGGESTDLVLAFGHKKVLEELADGQDTPIFADKGISRLSPGPSLEGNTMNISRDLTVAYYTYDMSGNQKSIRGYYGYGGEEDLYHRVLGKGAMVEIPESADRLRDALGSYVSLKR